MSDDVFSPPLERTSNIASHYHVRTHTRDDRKKAEGVRRKRTRGVFSTLLSAWRGPRRVVLFPLPCFHFTLIHSSAAACARRPRGKNNQRRKRHRRGVKKRRKYSHTRDGNVTELFPICVPSHLSREEKRRRRAVIFCTRGILCWEVASARQKLASTNMNRILHSGEEEAGLCGGRCAGGVLSLHTLHAREKRSLSARKTPDSLSASWRRIMSMYLIMTVNVSSSASYQCHRIS